ncbi:hypothetical protein CHUAL_006559 [Chamberlinius hualienensis]
MEEIIITELDEKQKLVIVETWKELEANISKVGVITFLKLFETHPDVQDYFPNLTGIASEDLKHSKQLQSHALKVMGFIQKVVARLHEPSKLTSLIRQLGKNHFLYGAKPAYIEFVGPQFLYAIKPSLEEKWTEDVENAWRSLFAYISAIMKLAMVEVQQSKEGN